MVQTKPGRRIAQPRLRHRFQTDVVGLERSRHRVMGDGEANDRQQDNANRRKEPNRASRRFEGHPITRRTVVSAGIIVR